MNLNLTLLGEIITFILLIFITVKFIWPPLTKAMDERQKKIADGLAAAERGQKGLQLAQQKIKDDFKKAKLEAQNIVSQADKRVAQMIDEARQKADGEALKIIDLAKIEISAEVAKSRQQLQTEIADLVMLTSSKILDQQLTPAIDQKLIDQVIGEIDGK